MSLDITGIGELATAASSIVNKFFPDKTQAEKDAVAIQMAQMMNEQNLRVGQIETNKIEAASTNWFVAGWRPFVGWVGGVGLAYASVIEPLMRFCAVQFGYQGTFPILDTSVTMQVLFGLLGLGTLRTVEKVKNSEGNR